MEPRDIVDRGLDKLSNAFERLIDRDFHRTWFTWLEWVTIAAIIYAVGRKTGSIVVLCVALFSGALLFFTAWFGIEKLAREHLPSISEKSRPVLFWLMVFLIAAVPFVVMVFLGEIFTGFVQ